MTFPGGVFNIPQTGLTTTADPARGGVSPQGNPYAGLGMGFTPAVNALTQGGGYAQQPPAYAPAPQGNTLDFSNLFSMSPVTGLSTSNQRSSSSSKSGINWDSPFMKLLQPQLNQAATDLRPDIENMGQTLQDQYSNLMRRGMSSEGFQGTLNSLANRGMMGSSMGGDAMASTAKGISKMIADQQFNSMLAQQQALQNIPNVLANLAQLGQESRSSGGSIGSSQSIQQNPFAPYQIALDFMKFQPSIQG